MKTKAGASPGWKPDIHGVVAVIMAASIVLFNIVALAGLLPTKPEMRGIAPGGRAPVRWPSAFWLHWGGGWPNGSGTTSSFAT